MGTAAIGVAEVRSDLLDEQHALDTVVAGLSPEQWRRPTPSPRWAVTHQIAHLAYFDRAAAIAIADPDAFGPMVEELWGMAGQGEEAVDAYVLSAYLPLGPDELLERWRADRAALADASTGLEDDTRVPWYGPSMGAKSFLTARLMEVWAHGQDVVDAVGTSRPATDRLRHVAQLGFITRGWSYANRGLEAPATDVRVELTAPSGATWTFGPDEAAESIVGPAEDFCLVTTQRRHVDDTALSVTGPAAREWMSKAQAFAGPATDGPARNR
jgi:uncharacterized protein (TIGR03084 family)